MQCNISKKEDPTGRYTQFIIEFYTYFEIFTLLKRLIKYSYYEIPLSAIHLTSGWRVRVV